MTATESKPDARPVSHPFGQKKQVLWAGLGLALLILCVIILPRAADAIFWYRQPSVPAIVTRFISDDSIASAVIAYGQLGGPPQIMTFGAAGASTQPSPDAAGPFEIADISRMITNEAILILADRGKLNLDAKLASIFPEVGRAADPRFADIEIRHLMQHTSGLGWSRHLDLLRRDHASFAAADACYPVLLERLKAPLDSAPGETVDETEFGPCWLGLVIARISGEPYETFVQEQLLRPRGITMHTMTDADFRAAQPAQAAEARIYFNSSTGWIASAADLYRLANRPIRGLEITGLVAAPDGGQSLGLGWSIWQAPDQAAEYSHTGRLGDARALMASTSDGIVLAALFKGVQKSEGLENFLKIEHGLIASIRREFAAARNEKQMEEERFKNIPQRCREDWSKCKTRI